MKKLILLLTFASLISTSATVCTWDPAQNGIFPPSVGNWNDSANWNGGVPDSNDRAMFNVPDAAECQVTDSQTCGQLVAGDNSLTDPLNNILRIVNGGHLAIGGTSTWTAIGYNRDAGSVIVERGGSLTVNGNLWVGLYGGAVGRLVLDGGDVIVAGALGLGHITGALGYVDINSGLLQARNLADSTDSVGSLWDIKFGKFVLTGGHDADRDYINSRIAAGTMVAFGGASTVHVEKINGNWTATAASDPLNRIPTMDAFVRGGPVDLSWINLDPIAPATDVWVDVWYIDLSIGTWNKVVSKSQNQTSVCVIAPGFGRYLWRVDTYRHGDPDVVVYGDDQELQVDKGITMAFAVPADCIFIGPADLDGDFKIDLEDFAILAAGWQTSYDFNDLLEMAETWLLACPMIP